MSITIGINIETCIKCGNCVRICPAKIFTQETPRSEIRLQHISSCIKCGHCVGICPTNSVIHSEFPPEKVHIIDKKLLPTPEQVMLLIKSRRSNRAFSGKPIPMEKLNQILEAAHCAPTASNRQQVEFTLITNPEKLKEIIDSTICIFSELMQAFQEAQSKSNDGNSTAAGLSNSLIYLTNLIEEHAKGNDPILRNATALILIHTPEESKFGCQDSNLAYQNGSLMAESLGVCQFYTGFLCTALMQDKNNRIGELLGIKGGVHAGMALAMPAIGFKNYIDREEIKVNKI